MENENRDVVHTKKGIVIESILITCCVGAALYFTNGIRKIPDEFSHKTTSICLELYVILLWFVISCRIARLRSICKFINRQIRYDMWRNYSLEYKFPFKYYNFAAMVIIGFEIFFVSVFVPVKYDNCAVYGNNKDICNVFNVIVINCIIWYTIGFGIVILTCCCYGCIVYYHTSNELANQPHLNTFNALAGDITGFTRPINIVSTDNMCPICMEDANSSSLEWSQLQCSHTFHTDCINHWLSVNPSCPICRTFPAPLNVQTV